VQPFGIARLPGAAGRAPAAFGNSSAAANTAAASVVMRRRRPFLIAHPYLVEVIRILGRGADRTLTPR
jgi:hypothetical protein